MHTSQLRTDFNSGRTICSRAFGSRNMGKLALAAAAAMFLGTTGYAKGVSSVLKNAGIGENSIEHSQVLNTLNIRPFLTPDEASIGDPFKVCKRRWLSSPFAVWKGFSTLSKVKTTMTTGDKRVYKYADIVETVNDIGEDSFDMTITSYSGDDDTQQTKVSFTRNDYIVSCLDTIEKQLEMDKLLKIRYQHDEPYLQDHSTEDQMFKLLVNTVTIKGMFPEGGTFQEENVTGVAHFWSYAKSMHTNEASIVMDTSGTIQGIVQLESNVIKTYTEDVNETEDGK